MLNAFFHDLRYALRSVLGKPWLAAAAILSLAIGIGANTTAYSVVHALLLSPVRGIGDPEQLVELGRTQKGQGFDTLSYKDFRDYESGSTAFENMYAFAPEALNVTAGAEPERAFGLLVSGGYFPTMRVHAAYGRLLSASDDAENDPQSVAVASYSAWQKYFAGDKNIVGKTISIDGRSFTLVGVAAPEFHGHIAVVTPDFYLPLHQRALLRRDSDDLFGERGSLWLMAGGRLKPGVDIAAAQVELSTIARRLAATYPDSDKDLGIAIAPLRGLPTGVRDPMLAFSEVLFALIGLILLVACVNVAGMLIARGESRRHEIAMRLALGARRRRIVGQLFAESVLLAAAAGVAGLALACWWCALIASAELPTPVPLNLDVPIDWHVVAFALALTLGTAFVFGLLPAMRVSSRAPRPGATSAQNTVRSSRLREGLVVVQIALTLTLLIGAGLLTGALKHAASMNVGFDVEQVLTADFDLDPSGYSAADRARAQQNFLERLQAIPGVEHAALATILPLAGDRMGFGCVHGVAAEELCPNVNTVSDGFFATLGMDVRGRAIDRRDSKTSADVAVINQTMAERLTPDGDAIGRSFSYGGDKDLRKITVIGIVPDGKYGSFDEARQPFVFLPLAQWPRAKAYLLAKTHLPQAEFAAQMRSALRAIDANLPPGQVHPLQDTLALSLLPQRLAATVSAILGAVGLLLAAIGLYGLIAYHVASRTREFGLKFALGATRARVLGEVLRRGAWLCAFGVVAGASIGVGLDLLISSLMFGAGGSDIMAFVVAAALLVGVALLACWLPARNAARIDPMVALRYE